MAIDYVVPMVFSDDAEWQKLLRRYDTENPNGHVRYRSWGTEHLLIRCVRKFMPWLRTIYIILAQESQKQEWMDELAMTSQHTEPQVRIIYHKEFIPQRFLPTFNSRQIEMFLKDIPDISDYFIYGNDDMFPVKPLSKEDFFVDGKPCQIYKEKDFPFPPNLFHLACMNGLNFVASQFGKHYSSTWLKGGHSIAPILKSTCRHLWKHHRESIERSITPFRDVRNYNQYIYGWYQHFSGCYVDHAPTRKYITIKKATVEDVKEVFNMDYSIVCINDNEAVDDIRPYAEITRKCLESKLQ